MASLPSCFETSLKQYYGPQCDLFRYGPGFHGALFGSLAVLLLVIMIVIAVIAKKRHMGFWWVLFKRKIMVDNFYVLLPVIIKLQTLPCEVNETLYFRKTRDLSNRRLSAFDEDFFDFSETGLSWSIYFCNRLAI